MLRESSHVGVTVLWKRWTDTRGGRVEKEKLLKRDQKWRTSVMECRFVRVVLCGVYMVVGVDVVLVGAVELLATEEAFVDVVVAGVTSEGESLRASAVATVAFVT